MKKLVLIVDDEASIRHLVRKVCKSTGDVECMEASSVREALELFSKHRFDLVVSDLNIPGESGLQIVEHIRGSGSKMPVMIFSGSILGDEEAKLREAGATEVLSKLSDIKVLAETIRGFLNCDKPAGR